MDRLTSGIRVIDMEHYIIEFLIAIIGIIIGWSINRTLGKIDATLEKHNILLAALEKNMENRPTYTKVEEIAKEKSEEAVKDHRLEFKHEPVD